MTQPFAKVLGAAGRALSQVVAPALDASNPLAREQLALVQRFLRLVAERADELGAAARAELALALHAGRQLRALAGFAPPVIQQRLDEALDAAGLLQRDAAAAPEALREAAARIEALASTLVRLAAGADPSVRRELRRAVIRSSAAQMALRRAWFAPLALDPDAASVPTWRDACARAHAAAPSSFPSHPHTGDPEP